MIARRMRMNTPSKVSSVTRLISYLTNTQGEQQPGWGSARDGM